MSGTSPSPILAAASSRHLSTLGVGARHQRRLIVGLLLIAQFATAPGIAAALCLGGEASREPWASATIRDAQGRALTRFIPPELHSGAAWSGSRALEIRPVNVTRKPQHPHDHPPITITGPHVDEKRPERATLRRERVSGRKGVVSQVFAINERGDGLGRLSDIRRDRVREMNECFKFPLGEWRAGEERRCRDSVIKILDLDFQHACVAHALKFRWNNEGTYIFSPERGMVSTETAEE